MTREHEISLRVIALCRRSMLRQAVGSEARQRAQRMLATYTHEHARLYGSEPSEAELAAAMERRAAELQDGALENSCNGSYHDPKSHTGANLHKQKGAHSTKGNPNNPTTKSPTPLKAAPGAKPQARVDAVEHALHATAKKGQVQRVALIGKKPLTIESGHPDYHGTRHASRHFIPGDSDARKTAKAVVLGIKTKDDDSVSSIRRHNKTMLADKESRLRLITSYKERKPKP